jgi:hypothetical protein
VDLEPQLFHGYVGDARFRAVHKLKLPGTHRVQVVIALVLLVRPQFRFQNRVSEDRLQIGHRLAVASQVDVQRPVTLRVNKDDLEGGVMRAALELLTDPLHAGLRVVLGVGK